MPGTASGAAPAIPLVTGTLPGLPSPATGLEGASTGLFSGGADLGDALKVAMQGYQIAQQSKIQRQQMQAANFKQAAEALQTIAPIALQNPDDPQAIQAIGNIYKQLGLNPSLAIKTMNGKQRVDTSALEEYSPWFKIISSPSFAFQPTEFQKTIYERAGISPKQNPVQLTDPKQFPGLLKNAQAALKNFDWETADAIGQQLVATGNPTYAAIGQGLVKSAQTKTIDPKTLSLINKNEAQTGLFKAETVEVNERTQLIKTQTGYIASQTALSGQRFRTEEFHTQVEARRIVQVQADTARAVAQTRKIYNDIAQSEPKLRAQLSRLSIDSIGHAVTAASDHNKTLSALQGNIDSLTKTIQAYQSGPAAMVTDNDPQSKTFGQQLPNPDLVLARQALQKNQELLKRMGGPIDIGKLAQSALHQGGLPNTVKVDKFSLPGDNESKSTKTRVKMQGVAVPKQPTHGTYNGQPGTAYPDGTFQSD